MTPLEYGLIRSARREKLTWETISQAMHRDVRTLQKAVRNKKFLRDHPETPGASL